MPKTARMHDVIGKSNEWVTRACRPAAAAMEKAAWAAKTIDGERGAAGASVSRKTLASLPSSTNRQCLAVNRASRYHVKSQKAVRGTGNNAGKEGESGGTTKRTAPIPQRASVGTSKRATAIFHSPITAAAS